MKHYNYIDDNLRFSYNAYSWRASMVPLLHRQYNVLLPLGHNVATLLRYKGRRSMRGIVKTWIFFDCIDSVLLDPEESGANSKAAWINTHTDSNYNSYYCVIESTRDGAGEIKKCTLLNNESLCYCSDLIHQLKRFTGNKKSITKSQYSKNFVNNVHIVVFNV